MAMRWLSFLRLPEAEAVTLSNISVCVQEADFDAAALLHDVGKIGIPDAIITKPSRLTQEEYIEIQKHPEIGAKILEPVEFIQPGPESALMAGDWRRQAHERGRQLSLPDALVASAAAAVDAAVLTRNVRDFALTPVRVETY